MMYYYNWTEQQVKAIVITDAIADILPRHCLPIMLDVGTNNEEIASNPLYIGLRQKRVVGKEYDEFINKFMQAVVQRFGWHCLIQFEDFASQQYKKKLLEKYQKHDCAFNDNIQDTTTIILVGLLAVLRKTNKRLNNNTYLFVGSGKDRCIFALGSPFKSVMYKDKICHPGLRSNAHIFSTIALATMTCAIRHVEDDLFLLVAEKLGSLITQKDLDSDHIYPSISTIPEMTIKIAVHLAKHLYKQKKA
ncbi:unnamed protein product [Rotaria sordida]|uniref:Malic enzyme N-terminal domain-containing protein n=1 Tax=Rotaria sordida TaxID=392033 RepID=A0A818YVG1_9BILA|nr:unnamed protein product [Rotaria sordida]CAF3759885.1 unnamed protein product [Rotaria sordida]